MQAEFSYPKDEFEEDVEIETSDLDLSYFPKGESMLSVENILQEQVYLTLPMKPLCTETCKGLCVQCGKNLNSGSCECRGADIGPRLAPLMKLQSEMTDRNKA